MAVDDKTFRGVRIELYREAAITRRSVAGAGAANFIAAGFTPERTR
jgi:hypothetical protein